MEPSFETFCADGQLLSEPISRPWVVFYEGGADGLPLDEEGIAIFRACTGREYEPGVVHPDIDGLIGRRAEKTSTALKYLLWKALYAGWHKQLRQSWFKRLGRHSRLLRIPLIAQDMRVTRDIQRALEAYLLSSKLIANEVEEILRTEIILANGIAFTCLPASKASVRGMTCPAALLDELAWVQIEGASDLELVRQVKPAMIQFGQERRLIKLSTPWLKSGVLYDEYAHRLEREDPLVWQASTAFMTPRISREELEKERLADPIYFSREFEAQFTDDLECFIQAADIAAAVGSWKELTPAAAPYYVAALDASGLSGGDKFTFGIAHTNDAGAKVDLLRGWRRASVVEVLDEIASLCKLYRIQNIVADQYSYAFVCELLRQRGVGLEQLAFSARSKPEVHFDLKNALAQGRFQIPNHPEAIRELRALESMRTSGGAYKIGAPRGQHDDFVTVLALLANRIKRSAPRDPVVGVISATGARWSDQKKLGPHDFGPERWWTKLN